MTRGALGRLHDDRSPVERDGHVMPAGAYSKNASFVDLDRRSIREPKNSMRSSAGAQAVALCQLVASSKLPVSRIRNAIGRAIDRLHFGAYSRRHLPIGFVHKERSSQKRKRRG